MNVVQIDCHLLVTCCREKPREVLTTLKETLREVLGSRVAELAASGVLGSEPKRGRSSEGVKCIAPFALAWSFWRVTWLACHSVNSLNCNENPDDVSKPTTYSFKDDRDEGSAPQPEPRVLNLDGSNSNSLKIWGLSQEPHAVYAKAKEVSLALTSTAHCRSNAEGSPTVSTLPRP